MPLMNNKNDENYVYYLVAKNLKKQRKLKGLTQREFAEMCNYSDGFIMNIESDKYLQTFSLGTLWKFAEMLDIDISEFFKPIDKDS
jgi:transcriptional regulator with XRE-family HTH domain